jgi:hypothetical protein
MRRAAPSTFERPPQHSLLLKSRSLVLRFGPSHHLPKVGHCVPFRVMNLVDKQPLVCSQSGIEAGLVSQATVKTVARMRPAGAGGKLIWWNFVLIPFLQHESSNGCPEIYRHQHNKDMRLTEAFAPLWPEA